MNGLRWTSGAVPLARLWLATGLTLVALVVQPTAATVYRVGAGGVGAGCDFSTISNAVAAVQSDGIADEIWVSVKAISWT